MNPVRIGDATLYEGDCREILPTLVQKGHIVTDPPYEDELHEAIGRIRRSDGIGMIKSLGFDGINAVRSDMARIMVSGCNGWLLLFSLAEGVRAWRDDLQTVGAKWDTTLAWVKPDSSPRFNGQGAARGFECIVTAWCGNGYRHWNGGGRRGVLTHCVNNKARYGHPTEKPLSLMCELIELYTDYDNLIVDPFMGSGTTGVAGTRLGRRFVGIEAQPHWFDLACRRIEEAQRQGSLFEPPRAKPVQERFL